MKEISFLSSSGTQSVLLCNGVNNEMLEAVLLGRHIHKHTCSEESLILYLPLFLLTVLLTVLSLLKKLHWAVKLLFFFSPPSALCGEFCRSGTSKHCSLHKNLQIKPDKTNQIVRETEGATDVSTLMVYKDSSSYNMTAQPKYTHKLRCQRALTCCESNEPFETGGF